MNKSVFKTQYLDDKVFRLNYFSALVFSFLLPFNFVFTRYILAFFIISGLFLGIRNFKEIFSRKNLFLLFTTALFLMYVISVLYSHNKELGYMQIQKKMPLLFLPLVFAISPLNKRNRKFILISFIGGLCVASVVCLGNFIYQIVSDENFARGFYNQPVGHFYSNFYIFDHSTYYATFLVFSIAALVALMKSSNFKHLKLRRVSTAIGTFLIVVFALLTFMISSRAGLLTLAVLSFVLIYQNFQRLKIRLALFSVLIFFAVVIFTNNRFLGSLGIFEELSQKEELDQKMIKEHSAIRLVLWKASFEVISENAWLGVGSGDIKDALSDKIVNDYNFDLKKPYNSHNQFLSTFVGTGIIGFIALAGIFIVTFIKAFQEKKLLMVNLLILLFIHFQFESMLGRLTGVLFFAFFLGLLYYDSENEREHAF